MSKIIKQTTFNDNDAGLGYMLYVVLSVLVLMGARFLIRMGVAYTDVFYYIYAFLVEAIFAVAVWIVCSIKNKNLVKASGLNKKVSVPIVVLCAAISLICLFGLGRLSDYFSEILGALGYQSSGSGVNVKNIGDLFIYTILVAILPAICEELLFRGLILRGLVKYGKNLAIYFSAFAFMIMHGSPDQTVHQFILGVIFGYIVYYTGNLWITIIIHFCNNFFVLVATFIVNLMQQPASAGSAGSSVAGASSTLSIIFSYIISVAIIAISVYLVVVSIKRLVVINHNINNSPNYLTNEDLKPFKIEKVESNEQELENANFEIEEEANTSGGVVVEKLGDNGAIPPILNKRKNEKIGLLTTLMFTITTIYLAVEWILALVGGFGG